MASFGEPGTRPRGRLPHGIALLTAFEAERLSAAKRLT